jgi:hypothetical protein
MGLHGLEQGYLYLLYLLLHNDRSRSVKIDNCINGTKYDNWQFKHKNSIKENNITQKLLQKLMANIQNLF